MPYDQVFITCNSKENKKFRSSLFWETHVARPNEGGQNEVEAGLVSRLSCTVEAVHVGTWKAGGSKESADQWGWSNSVSWSVIRQSIALRGKLEYILNRIWIYLTKGQWNVRYQIARRHFHEKSNLFCRKSGAECSNYVICWRKSVELRSVIGEFSCVGVITRWWNKLTNIMTEYTYISLLEIKLWWSRNLDVQVFFSRFLKTWKLLHRIQPKFGEIGFNIIG